jgi:hypothetical protein
MRSIHAILIGFAVIACIPTAVAAAPTSSIELKADVVDYYSNRFVLTADGHVHARLTDGTVITGDAFSVDLKLNRYLIAGHVHVAGRNINLDAAAIAGYPDLDRTYVVTTGLHPDRWTFFDQDYTNDHAGRQQPGDAFYFPDLSNAKPYIITNSATLFLKNNVEFPVGSRIYLAGVYVPTPGYVINYSANSNFYQNAYSGAIFNIGVPYHGAADAISEFDIRGDEYRGVYLSFEQHFVHNLDYAVFSVNPLTQNQRQWNAILYKRISPDVEARLFYQLSTLSVFLGQPQQASSYANLLVNWRLGRYAMSVDADQYNNDLLGNAQDAVAADGLNQAGHPFDAQVTIQSFEDEFRFFRHIGVPVKFQYRAGFGQIHDGLGIQTITGETFGGVQYNTQYQKFLGATVYTSPVRIARQLTLSAKYDEQQQWFSLPHHVVNETFNTTLAYTPLRVSLPAFFLSYNVTNVGDFYGAQQRLAYPAFENTVTTPYGTYTGLAAFDGFATSRYYTGAMVFSPTPYFSFNLTIQRFFTTPAPVPGLGGQPPWQMTPDVRIRISHNILVDVNNTYYFNFGGLKWAPTTNVQVSP